MKMLCIQSIFYLIVFIVGAVAGSIQVAWMPGVPAHGRYHASDSDYLQEDLLGVSLRPGPSAPTADHPAWQAVCGVYQKISAMFDLSGMTLWNIATPVMLGINLCLFLLLTRNLGFDRAQGLGLTVLLLSTGATVNWSLVLETHVLAPTSLLLAALILSDRRMVPRIW
ncbi:MAG: hypothetical protein O3A31_12415, partial [Planctomycetota bacterium]|nr:hypothetical protein [Planctomycetota bacterium]